MSTPGAIAVGLWAQNQLAGVMKFKLPFTFVLMRNALSHLTLTLIERKMSLTETFNIFSWQRQKNEKLLMQQLF